MPKDVESLKAAFLSIAQFKDAPIKKDLSLYLLTIAVGLILIEWGLIGTKYKVI